MHVTFWLPCNLYIQVVNIGLCEAQPLQLDEKDNQKEPASKRLAKRAEKTSPPPKKKKKPSGGVKVPLVRVSDTARRKIIVLNVVGLLCDIRALHDRREWGPDLVVHYEKDLNVKIKKRSNCDSFLSMLCSHFDVGIWSPIEETVLGW